MTIFPKSAVAHTVADLMKELSALPPEATIVVAFRSHQDRALLADDANDTSYRFDVAVRAAIDGTHAHVAIVPRPVDGLVL